MGVGGAYALCVLNDINIFNHGWQERQLFPGDGDWVVKKINKGEASCHCALLYIKCEHTQKEGWRHK